jgi:hypothetical protein
VAWLFSGSGSRIGAGEAISIEGGTAFNFPPSLNAVPVVLLEEHFGEPTENVLDKIGEAHIAPPVLWAGWEAYYHIMNYEGDRAVDVN